MVYNEQNPRDLNAFHSADDLVYAYSKPQMFGFVIFLLLYEIAAYVANDMIMPGMIEVIKTFHVDESYISSSLTAYLLGGSSLQIILGPLSDRFGRKPLMLIGVTLFLIFTILIAFSTTINSFILLRFFQGMGLCFIGVIGYAVLQEVFTETPAVRIIAIMSNISILAPLAGPLLGSIVIHIFNWRVIFHFIAIAAAISLAGIWYFMPETVGIEKIDGTIQDPTPLNLSTLRQNYLTLLKNMHFMLCSIAFGLASVPIIAWIGTSPIMLIHSAHLTVIEYGLAQVPIFLAAIAGNLAMRHATQYMSLSSIIRYGSYGFVVSLLLMTLAGFYQPDYRVVIAGMSLYAFAMGFISAPLNRIALFTTAIPKGTASALISVILMVICSIGNQLAGWLYLNYDMMSFFIFNGAVALIYQYVYNLYKRR